MFTVPAYGLVMALYIDCSAEPPGELFCKILSARG